MLTLEQQQVVDTVCSSIGEGKIIAVEAVAGSGKTSTAKAVIEAYKPKQGFYTAFNKAIVTDSAGKFGNLIDCKTIHSLAYRYVRPKRPIEELTVLSIKEDLDYETKTTIINLLDSFFRSSYTDVYQFVVANTNPKEYVIRNLVPLYAELMLEGKIPPTFNFLLKCLHLQLLAGNITINKDLLIFDEMQDTTGVMLEIFKLINADRKLILGDKFQNIYSFMNTINAFNELKDLYTLRLTKSFRCNEEIANLIDSFGKKYLDSNFVYTGNPEVQDNNGIVYLARSNASLINRMYELLKINKSFSLNRDSASIFALPIALVNANAGRPVYDKRYKFLEKEYNTFNTKRSYYKTFFSYLEDNLDDPIINNVAKLINKLYCKGISIFDIRLKIQNMKPNKDVVLSTVHTFKGLEKGTAYIEEDLNQALYNVDYHINELRMYDYLYNNNNKEIYSMLSTENKEVLNLYYVALSRAKVKILNSKYKG